MISITDFFSDVFLRIVRFYLPNFSKSCIPNFQKLKTYAALVNLFPLLSKLHNLPRADQPITGVICFQVHQSDEDFFWQKKKTSTSLQKPENTTSLPNNTEFSKYSLRADNFLFIPEKIFSFSLSSFRLGDGFDYFPPNRMYDILRGMCYCIIIKSTTQSFITTTRTNLVSCVFLLTINQQI